MRRSVKLTTLLILCTTVGFAAGVGVGHFQAWPFSLISKLYRIRGTRVAEARSEAAFSDLRAIEVSDLRRVSSNSKIIERRDSLTRYIWPQQGFPSNRLPDSVSPDILDSPFGPVPNLRRTSRLKTVMKWGVVSTAYYLEPAHGRQCLMIYHHGHGHGFQGASPVIGRLIGSGCTVLAFAMPLEGGGQPPVVNDSVLGSIPLLSHEALSVLESPTFSPISYFVEPIAAALNYVLKRESFQRIGMLGFSGGGWTTTLYAALDERIGASYPVAGSEPTWIMARRPEGWLDYEQTNIGLYRRASYPELYVMAVSSGRRQMQVLNRFDACCFYGRASRFYASAVGEAARDIGGSFRIFVDETHREHKLSVVALDSVLADFLGPSKKGLAAGAASPTPKRVP